MIEEYFLHWWNGELATNYDLWGLTIPQCNKLLKIGQYLVGLMALFELIQFSVVMRSLRIVSFLSIFTIRMPNYIMSIPSISLKLISGSTAFITRQIRFKDMLVRSFKNHYENAIRGASNSAKSHLTVRAFEWLEKHPLSERARRLIVFGAFIILSLADLFTS
jgi:hypothetical protein